MLVTGVVTRDLYGTNENGYTLENLTTKLHFVKKDGENYKSTKDSVECKITKVLSFGPGVPSEW